MLINADVQLCSCREDRLTMAKSAFRWSPVKTARREFIISGIFILMGAAEILMSLLWGGSGVYAVLGAVWLLVGAMWFAGALERRRGE
jgi:hypothetical protein